MGFRKGMTVCLLTTCMIVPAVTGAEEDDRATTERDVRQALSDAVSHLTSRPERNEVGGFVLAPGKEPKRRVGYGTASNVVRTVRYRMQETRYREQPLRYRKVIERYTKQTEYIPVYKPIYKDAIQVQRQGVSAGATQKLTKGKTVVGRKVVGKRKVERLVKDPMGSIRKERLVPDADGSVIRGKTLVPDTEGPVVRKSEVQDPSGSIVRVYTNQVPAGPIYAEGAELWPEGFLGANAMALYALRRSGVSGTDKNAQRIASSLVQRCKIYGLPDTTWDLAWITAALARMPGDYYGDACRSVASKLADGQIVDSAAKGLWGPVCINTRLLAAMIEHELALTEKVERSQQKSRTTRRPSRARPPANAVESKGELGRAEKNLKTFQENYRLVTMQGRRFQEIQNPYRIEPPMGECPVQMPGLPFNIYRFGMADMDSTAIAVFGLMEAHLAGRLPQKTQRPVLENFRATSVMMSKRLSTVLATAAKAIADRKPKSGNWKNAVVVYKINHFEGVYRDDSAAIRLPSVQAKATHLATLQAYSVLADIGQIVGLPKLLGKHRQSFAHGWRGYEKILSEYANGAANRSAPGWDAITDFCVPARDFGSRPSDHAITSRGAWRGLASRLLDRQLPGGYWRESDDYNPSSCLKDLQRVRAESPEQLARRTSAYYRTSTDADSECSSVIGTAQAMVFLAANVRPPVAGVCADSRGAPVPKRLDWIIDQISKQYGVSLSPAVITPSTGFAEVKNLPVLVVSPGQGSKWLEDSTTATLRKYGESAGTVIVEAPAAAEGLKFIAAAKKKLMAGGSPSVTVIPADNPLLEGLRSKVRLWGQLRSDGSVQSIFLPVAISQGPSDKTVDATLATKITVRLIMQNSDPAILSPAYASVIAEDASSDEFDVEW